MTLRRAVHFYSIFLEGYVVFPISKPKTQNCHNFRLMMQMTSYWNHNFIPWRETNSEILVKIRQNGVTWRHMTSFYVFLLKYWWRHQKCFTGGGQQIQVIWIRPHNSFDLKGQPLFYDKWFKSRALNSIFEENMENMGESSKKYGWFMRIFSESMGKIWVKNGYFTGHR